MWRANRGKKHQNLCHLIVVRRRPDYSRSINYGNGWGNDMERAHIFLYAWYVICVTAGGQTILSNEGLVWFQDRFKRENCKVNMSAQGCMVSRKGCPNLAEWYSGRRTFLTCVAWCCGCPFFLSFLGLSSFKIDCHSTMCSNHLRPTTRMQTQLPAKSNIPVNSGSSRSTSTVEFFIRSNGVSWQKECL